MTQSKKIDVCLVGAGNIAHTHAEVLSKMDHINMVAVVEPNRHVAEKFATKFQIPHIYPSAEDLLGERTVDAAHILVPPQFHASCAKPFLEKNIRVLLEKPLATSADEASELQAIASASGAEFGVNQNFIFHPAFEKARRLISGGRLGPVQSIDCLYAMPLRQLASRQFGHWMFRDPKNLLLEQAIHPLSQIMSLTGPIDVVSANCGASEEISPGVDFYQKSSFTGQAEDVTLQMQFEVGTVFPTWRLGIQCSDGRIEVDIIHNLIEVDCRGPYMDFVDHLFQGGRQAASKIFQNSMNAARYLLSILGVTSRSDTFYRSMKSSINRFHADPEGEEKYLCNGDFGAALVSVCEEIFHRSNMNEPITLEHTKCDKEIFDVVVFGGTGFIGRHLVKKLSAEGQSVLVVARNTANLAGEFYDQNVLLMQGDVNSLDAVKSAIERASKVVNLAHGGGGETWDEIRVAMVGSAQLVAEECLRQNKSHLIHIGSIASLFLGDASETITSQTLQDPKSGERADYARAKSLCDERLLEMAKNDGLPLTILRPGVVVGAGGDPFHSGLGFYNNTQYCLGWNLGNNPLPFVLVDDVVDAIALSLKIEEPSGKTYNLVGDVRPSARQYIAALAGRTGRPLVFKPQLTIWLYGIECLKWGIKRIGGRNVPLPSKYDLLSRGLSANFDCSLEKQELNWHPESRLDGFFDKAFADCQRR